jgi:hypothetical protein
MNTTDKGNIIKYIAIGGCLLNVSYLVGAVVEGGFSEEAWDMMGNPVQGAAWNEGNPNGEEPLYNAVGNGNPAEVEVSPSADVNVEGDAHNPLVIGLLRGDSIARETARRLLNQGIDGRSEASLSGVPLLHCAVALGEIETTMMLVGQGADENGKDCEGLAPLHYAISNGNLRVATELIKLGADVNIHGPEDCTPLHIAAFRGDETIVQVLCELGADVDARNRKGETPLFSAASGGNVAIVQVLLDRGADVNIRNYDGETLLDKIKTANAKIDSGELLDETEVHKYKYDGYELLIIEGLLRRKGAKTSGEINEPLVLSVLGALGAFVYLSVRLFF